MEKMKVRKKFTVKKSRSEPSISIEMGSEKRKLQIPCKVRWFVAIEMDILHFELSQGDVLEMCISF